jgi:hypothetical protein
VSLTSSDCLPHYAAIDGIVLATGSFYALVGNLPAETYQLSAVYGGDGTFAASNSSPVTVAVTPENDKLATAAHTLKAAAVCAQSASSGFGHQRSTASMKAGR